MQAAGSIVVAMVAHGKDHKTSWPFVTLSSFQQRAATVKDLVSISTLAYRKNRSPIRWSQWGWHLTFFVLCAFLPSTQSGALYVGFNPIVGIKTSPKQNKSTQARVLPSHVWALLVPRISTQVRREHRLEWENYTNNSPEADWYEQGRAYQKAMGFDDLDNRPQVKTDDPNLILTTGVANYIYDFQRDTTGKAVISPDADWCKNNGLTKCCLSNIRRLESNLSLTLLFVSLLCWTS